MPIFDLPYVPTALAPVMLDTTSARFRIYFPVASILFGDPDIRQRQPLTDGWPEVTCPTRIRFSTPLGKGVLEEIPLLAERIRTI